MYLLGVMLLFFAVAFIASAVVGFIYFEASSWIFVFCSVSCFMLGTLLKACYKDHKSFLSKKDGRLVIGLVWLILPLIGAVPYTFLSSRFTLIDAVFESFSGFTTTGSTLLTHFSDIPKSILFWRALTQWIGCLGFILFLISLMPSLRNDVNNFFDTEFNSINKSKVKPHLRATIYMIFVIYLLISGLCFAGLLLAKMDLFNAICYTFATVSTGGFMSNDGGFAAFSPYVRLVLILIMFLSGISYYLIYYLITSKRKQIFRDQQVKIYTKLILYSSLILSFYFYFKTNFSTDIHIILSAIGKGFFYVTSAVSTAGFSYSSQVLPLFAAVFIVFLMFPGGCSASSSTGLKIIRVTILSRYAIAAIKRIIFPRAIIPVRFNETAIKDESINMIFGFFFLYILVCIFGASLLTMCGISFDDGIMIAAANINNVGSLGEEVSSTFFTYVAINDWAKIILMFLMITGRLELYSFFALFSCFIWSRS
jgi:trk system potassium uptake protein TrkH